MNNLTKMRIVAYKGGVPVGYVKSVSYKNGTFTLTQDKMFAKTYSKQEKIMSDIDTIAYQGQQKGFVFSIG